MLLPASKIASLFGVKLPKTRVDGIIALLPDFAIQEIEFDKRTKSSAATENIIENN
jgi:hypothetical protein